MPKLIWTTPARNDLRRINAWLTERASPAIALRSLVEIRTRARFLENFPHGGRPVLDRDFRVLRVHDTSYLIVYRLNGPNIDLLRIAHEREDWQVHV